MAEQAQTPPIIRKSGQGKKWALGCLGLFGLLVLVGICSSLITTQSEDSGGATDEARSREERPTAETAYESLRSSATYPDMAATALDKARKLIEEYPGTPEADSAAAMIPALEEAAAAYAAGEAERQKERAAQALASKWSYRSATDPMTSGTTRTARIFSENTINLDFPYQGEQHATLMLRDHPSYGRAVILQIEQGQFLCPSYTTCQVRVRFDDGEPQRWNGVGPSDNSTTTVFIRNYDRFITRLRSAQVVRIQLEIYQAGAPVFEFHVGGFDLGRYTGN